MLLFKHKHYYQQTVDVTITKEEGKRAIITLHKEAVGQEI